MNNKPKHVAIIMDGNGRWASSKGLSRILGYKMGLKVVNEIIDFSVIYKLYSLTLYVFSTENWFRPKLEVSELMRIFSISIKNKIDYFVKKNICVKIIGNKKNFYFNLYKNIKKVEKVTKNNNGLKLNLAIDYSGKWDFLNCVKRVVRKIIKKKSLINKINEDFISKNLCLYNQPPVDLVIRTGGEKRISNFLLWQIVYSELFFIDKLWPDFNKSDFVFILNSFLKRRRKFGKI